MIHDEQWTKELEEAARETLRVKRVAARYGLDAGKFYVDFLQWVGRSPFGITTGIWLIENYGPRIMREQISSSGAELLQNMRGGEV